MPAVKEKRVRNLMVHMQDMPSISPETGLREALEFMTFNTAETGERSVVLLRGKDGPEGIIGMTDILGAVKSGEITNTYFRGWSLPGYWSSPTHAKGLFTLKCRTAGAKRVRDVMRPIQYDLRPGDTLDKAADIFFKKNAQWLAVGEKGRLLGVLNIHELIREIRNVWGDEKPAGEVIDHGITPDVSLKMRKTLKGI